MNIKRAFITGGSGFVGKQLISELRKKHIEVIALARSQNSALTLRKLGAAAIIGDLHATELLAATITDCDVVFHLAAVTIRAGGTEDEFYRTNVLGTKSILAATKKAGVKRFVFISTEAVLLGGRPIINADESWLIPTTPTGAYALTKARAEKEVREANSSRLTTVILRPRLIWGKNSKGIEEIIEKARKGRFIFIDHGKQVTSTCHVKNVCEALLLAAEKGRGGETYFISDGKPIELHTFVSNIFKAKKISPVQKSIPFWFAWIIAYIVELYWKIGNFKSNPPFTRVSVLLLGKDVTVNDTKARRELGYRGKISMEQGFEEFTIP